jgi:galactose mutarotase-like enzyme
MSKPAPSPALISSNVLRAEIEPLGAQLFTLKDAAGRDLLWDGDPKFWNGRAPLLFPIVGALADGRYRLGDETYAMPKHGFARHRLFKRVDHTTSSVTFRLSTDSETLAIYPFQFELDVTFVVEGPNLTMAACVSNSGDVGLPASFGFHPAFRWPLPYGQRRDAHRVRFEKSELAPIRRIDPNGLIRSETYDNPIRDRDLMLRDDLFTDDVIIFDRLSSRRVSYGADVGPRLDIEFSDLPYLGVWTKPNANFICIEPWHGFADPIGFLSDFLKKPGGFIVPSGGEQRLSMTISLRYEGGSDFGETGQRVVR